MDISGLLFGMQNNSNHNGAPVTVRELITIQNGEPLADSRDIAAGLGIEHSAFIATIDKHKELIESEFERVLFEKGPFQTPGGVQQIRYALLTEDQTNYIGTLSRNSPTVLRFKAALVKAFRDARRALEKAPAPSHDDGMELAFKMTRASRLPAPGTPGYLELLDVHLQAVHQLVDLHKEVVQTKQRVRTLTRENGGYVAEILDLEDARAADRPKLRVYEDFLSTSGEYSWALAAKALNTESRPMGRNRLLKILREEGVLIGGGPNHNTPHQKYINSGYFRVYRNSNFPDGLTTVVKPKGMAFLSRKLEEVRDRRPLHEVVPDSRN